MKVGPGGVKCVCCRPIPMRELKEKTNRYLRRQAKREQNED